MRRALFLAATVCLAVVAARAQDPAKIDPQHYKVEAENQQVRVLRIHLGPHEKVPMHSHPAYVMISLTDTNTRSTSPDGMTRVSQTKAGTVTLNLAQKHASENLTDKPIEVILIELKGVPSVKWHAYCDTTEKPPWTGPTRESIADAQRDADGHNEKNPKHHATVKAEE